MSENSSAHVRDPGADRGDHQREPLGDAAGVDAGPVQGRPALAAGRLDRLDLRRIGVDPPDRRHHALARAEQRGHLGVVRHQRAVDHAVGVQSEDLLGAGRRRDPDRVGAEDLADVLAVLVVRVHPAADQLQVGMAEHPLDRRLAHATGGPLHDPDRLLARHGADSAVPTDTCQDADPSLLLTSNDGSTCTSLPSRRYSSRVTTGRRAHRCRAVVTAHE